MLTETAVTLGFICMNVDVTLHDKLGTSFKADIIKVYIQTMDHRRTLVENIVGNYDLI